MDMIKTLVKNEGVEDKVDFLGHVSHEALLRELSKASCFLLPSFQENAPMAISEAMAVGVPVVTSNRCGMPYMVADQESGYIIEPDDTDQIAKCLSNILNNESLHSSMSAKSVEIALERFHPRAVAEKTRKVYEPKN